MDSTRLLITITKYFNLAYAGAVLGIAAWFIYLLVNGYHFGTGMAPVITAAVVLIVLTIIFAALNMFINELIKPRR